MRPSAILEVPDAWTAFQLDEACLIAGRQLEREVAEGGGSVGTKGYSSPDPGRVRKRKMDARGIW